MKFCPGFTVAAILLLMTGKVITHQKKPNVLFLVVDDLRPTLGCYDNPTFMKTRNIDNLASKSVLFEKAFVQQAICGPSRTSFLTSRRPDTTRLYDFYSYWRVHAGNYTTLPQHFKENGYITQSVGKIFHPGKASNFSDDAPYSWTNTPYHSSSHKYKMWKVCPNPDGTRTMNIVCPVDVENMPEKTLPDIQSADFSVDFLKNMSTSNTDKPFFLAVGFRKPHIPLKYPKEYLDLYPLSEIGLAKHRTYPLRMPLVAWNPWTDLRMRDDVMKLNISFPFGPVPEYFQRLMRQSYYAATSYMDTQVGRVLAALEKGGFADNTIISFVGDHGWALGEHQEWSKYSLFSAAVQVPLMMYIPGVTHDRHDKNKPVFPFFDPFENEASSRKDPFSDNNFDPFKDSHSSLDLKSSQFVMKINNSKMRYGLNNIPRNMDHQPSRPGYRTSALVELVDMFPTLADAAGLPKLPQCPVNPFKVMLCTEGASMMPLIRKVVSQNGNDQKTTFHNASHKADTFDSIYTYAKECYPNFTIPTELIKWKKAVFSQYPRPSVEPQEDSDKPHLKHIKIMGYSMWTPAFHYTEWVKFTPKNYKIHWNKIYGRELYLVQSDPYEIHNLALFDRCFHLASVLSHRLHKGWRIALPDGITA